VCYRPTPTVLATINTVDFIYVCPGHLSDTNFASRIADADAPAKSSVSAEEIAKIKQEWEDKQKKKQEKGKEDGKEKEDGKDKKSDAGSSKEASKSPTPAPAASTKPAAPAHERYSLHRDFYAS
jgi:hypothetical protein